MNKKRNIIIILIAILLVIILAVSLMFYGLTPVSKKDEPVVFIVKKGDSKITIIDKLKEADLVKSKIASYIYVVLNSGLNLQAGEYKLNRNMSLMELLDQISSGKIYKETKNVTFLEGKRLVDYVKVISENFGYSSSEILDTLNDKEYLNTLISKYDCLTEDILNEQIYYPLEGYLFPDTYEFYNNASIKDIIERMLSKTEAVFKSMNFSEKNSKYSIHEALTMASIIENEAMFAKDRSKVSQVIEKRIALKMPLQMDSTASYGVHKALIDITKIDLKDNNAYNTYNTNFIGLPVGPISNPGKSSIEAVFNPSDTDYLFFCSNLKTGETFFTKTNTEHEKAIKEDCKLR